MRPKASPNAEQPSARRNVVSTLPTAPRLSSAAQPETTGVHHPHLQEMCTATLAVSSRPPSANFEKGGVSSGCLHTETNNDDTETSASNEPEVPLPGLQSQTTRHWRDGGAPALTVRPRPPTGSGGGLVGDP
eukprot:CAMPEP_0174304798 /NCGR_PEP_ID=MMETSP0809-20121228/61007_1 /TAXON_ID=73025 ORGANISM="Eutreptiella gymnastica-like, Strain CCMP1594" /NCGR_SAMPLE_ID=MMETSP0809 /ASSEMBLY_ACC=CAM_ASM_000658 /LENGTH=131 /DNA_ID=CAMNT_0015411109 /DNA_START=546 /DNA_END=941 /DNA_ORIENTATION=+